VYSEEKSSESENIYVRVKKEVDLKQFYPANLSYMDALESFIKNEKPIIDKFVKENPELKLEAANQLTHDKYVKKILDMELGGSSLA